MNKKTSHRKESAAAKAARELAQLQQQGEEARAVLTRLQQEVVETQSRLDSNQTSQLREANEQLVLAILRAQTAAETAAQTLGRARTDAGTAAETAAQTLKRAHTDAETAAETAAQSLEQAHADAGTAAETAAQTLEQAHTAAGTAAETAARTLKRAHTDAGTAAKTAARTLKRAHTNAETAAKSAALMLKRAHIDAETAAGTAAQALDEASRSAEFDALTALPNRALLLDRFAHAIAQARRHGTRMALLFLDLNNFKQINDTLGHAVGDEVLKLAAQRLGSLVRDVDTVSRYGGDEFLILLTEVSHASDAILVAEKVITSLGTPSRVGDHVLRLTASIGISVYPDDGEDAEMLIDRADAAMYRAKRHGLGSFASHGQELPDERSLQSSTLTSLQHPFTHYEFASAEHERRHVQLREANGELVLAALSAQELQAAAEEAQRQQKEFLAVVAHELRNPLTPIRIAAEMLGLVDTKEIPRYQAIIEHEIEHMVRLVSDLLDVSRVNTGKLRLEPQTVDMAVIIDAAISACRPAMDTRLQQIGVQVPARGLEVHGDPVRLAQIIRNLLDNASKYTPKGGEIGLSVAVAGNAMVMTVSDSGIGITAEALPKVFEPFVQEPHAIGFSGAGLGIGLTVVRELVEAHGGTVVASSAGTGLGSQFVVTLPLIRPKQPSKSRRKSETARVRAAAPRV